METINFATYNSGGFAHDKRKFIESLLESTDVLFIQEHWLNHGNLGELDKVGADFENTGESGMPVGELRGRGRPYGGVAIFFSDRIAHQVERDLPKPKEKNISQIKIGNTLVINAYMPGDNYRQTHVRPEFQAAIDDIENLIKESDSNEVIVGGDLNCDISRDNAHTRCIKDFASRNGLKFVQQHQYANSYQYTFNQAMENGTERMSCIDHFLVSDSIYDNIVNVNCDKMSALNPSYHCPLTMRVKLGVEKREPEMPEPSEPAKPRIAWHKVKSSHIDIYRNVVRRKLGARRLPEVVHCNDTRCKNPLHHRQLDEYASFLTDACISAADDCLPKVKNGNAQPIPNWSEEIEMKKTDALEHFWIWEVAGKPNSGPLFDSMRRSKRQYHYAIRSVQRNASNIRNNKLAEALASGRDSDMFKEIKRADGKSRKPTNIDGIFDEKDIVNLFARKNETLYNSVPSDASIIDNIRSKCEEQISADDTFIVTIASIQKAIDKSNPNKSDGETRLTSSHLKAAPIELSVHLSLLFSAMGRHGYVASSLLKGTITHIPKDPRASLRDSANYRGICLSSPIVKLLEEVTIDSYGHCLITSDMQFAYKKKHSASAATLTLKELVRFYKQKNTWVFAAALDASKTFDRVRHDKLYQILLDRGLPPLVLRLLIDMYERQTSRCRYFDTYSEYYAISNGVRQGGVASPILFLVYMDILYSRLEAAGVGCHIGTVFYGMIGYADDILLLATSIRALNQILKTCADFGREYDITYNASKSKFIVLGSSRNDICGSKVLLDGQEIKRVEEIEFLGNTIRADLSEKSDVKAKVEDLCSRVNALKFSLAGAAYKVLSRLFTVKCAHAYGSEAWVFNDKSTKGYWSAYGQGVRRLLGVPPSCPTTVIESITGTKGAPHVNLMKFINLAKSMKNSVNSRIKFIYDIASADARSVISRNLAYINELWGSLNPPVVTPDGSGLTEDICQLLDAREGRLDLGLTSDDIDDRMLFLCMR